MPTFSCPHCGERLTAPPERAGKALVCPLCGQSALVPGQPPEAAPAVEQAEPVPFGQPPQPAVAVKPQRPMSRKDAWVAGIAIAATLAAVVFAEVVGGRYADPPTAAERRATSAQFEQAEQRATLQRQVDQCLPYAQQVIGELGGLIDASLSQSGQSVVVEVRVPMVMDEAHALEIAYAARKYFHAVSADTLVTVRVHSPAGQTLAEKSFYPWTAIN